MRGALPAPPLSLIQSSRRTTMGNMGLIVALALGAVVFLIAGVIELIN
jgi:hypothetical protein